MTPKAFLTLTAVTVVATVAAIAVGVAHYGAVQTERSEGAVFPGLSETINSVAEIEVVADGKSASVRRKGDVWVIPDKSDYPANADKVRKTLIDLTELQMFEPKTAKPELYAKLGLDDEKARRVILKDAEGKVLADSYFGRSRMNLARVGGHGAYIRKPDSEQTWLAKGPLAVGAGPMFWLDREFIAVDRGRVKRVSKTTADGTLMVFSRISKDEEKFDIQGLPEGATKGKEADDKAMDVARALNALDMTDVKPVSEVDFSKGNVTTAEYVTYGGLVVDISLKLIDPENEDDDPIAWMKVDVSAAPPAASAKVDAIKKEAAMLAARYKGWVYRVSPWSMKNLQLKPSDFVDGPAEKKS